MRRFPGTLARGGRNHRAAVLSDEQREWFFRWFPVTENRRMAKAMGLSQSAVRQMARRMGLRKSDAGRAAIHRRSARIMARTFERRGLYAAKRNRPSSPATKEGVRRFWEDVREGRRLSPLDTMRQNPKRYAAYIARISADRKETIRKEKLRLVYGLGRKTRLTAVVLKPFTRSQIAHRSNALKRGYLLDYDCSEGTAGRYVIYYDGETERSEQFERNCMKDGFTFMKDG